MADPEREVIIDEETAGDEDMAVDDDVADEDGIGGLEDIEAQAPERIPFSEYVFKICASRNGRFTNIKGAFLAICVRLLSS